MLSNFIFQNLGLDFSYIIRKIKNYPIKQIYIVFIICSINLPIFSNEEENKIESTLEWESVKSARGYHIQIRNSKKKIVVDEKIQVTKYTMNLSEGEYEERLGVYNKFGKIAGYSDWEKISINKVFNPQIETSGEELYHDTSPQKIEITGSHFTSDSKVVVKSNTHKIDVLEVIYKNEKKLEVILKIDDAVPGNYDLVIINPRNKKAIAPNFLKLIEKKIEISIQNEPISDIEKKISFQMIPEKNSIFNGLRSSLLPGLGQYNKNQKGKAAFYMVAMLGSLTYFGRNVADYSENKNNYDRSTNDGIFLSANQQNLSNGTILYNLYQSNQYLNQAQSNAASASQALVLVNLIYLVNIFDALYSKTEPDVSIKPGFQIHSNYNFQSFAPGLPVNSQYELGLKWNF
jgi:hypothetical protein